MKIINAQVFIDHAFVNADIEFDEKISAVRMRSDQPASDNIETEAVINAVGCYVIPGLVDVHTHGAVGEDFSDGRPQGLQPMAVHYAAHGVTTYLASTMTLSEEVLTSAMHALRDFRRCGGAKCAGVHLEGPFLSAAKKGAQAEEHLHRPDVAMFDRLNEASGNQVKMVTVACEEPGAMDFIREVAPRCTVAIGHSVADYDTAMAAFAAGATHATHLFNGMPSLLHRAPSIIGAAMDSNANAELICDGLHIHPSVIRAAHKLFGDKLLLISDSLRCAGMADGEYDLGGQRISLVNGKATLVGTDTLAGSCITVFDALRNAVRFGIPLEDAVYAASTAPAMAVGIDAGKIAVGRAADLLILDPQLDLLGVFIDGQRQRNIVS